MTSECCTCGNDPYQTAEGKRKAEKGHGGYISVIGFTPHILKKNTGISIDVRMLHMWDRPLSDCREEKKKVEKGHGDHIFLTKWGVHGHFGIYDVTFMTNVLRHSSMVKYKPYRWPFDQNTFSNNTTTIKRWKHHALPYHAHHVVALALIGQLAVTLYVETHEHLSSINI